MQHIHFIAIGGAAMHSLAIALSLSGNCRVTGSDDEIFEPSYGRLLQYGLLPKEMGWYPERITTELDAVVLGMHAKEDNPELLKAKEIGVKIFSFPEFLYENTKDKKRIVIGGSHGKTTTTAMILHVFNVLGINADYLVGAQIEGLENTVRLSEDAEIAVFEGDEYLTSPLDRRPKFHLYKPNVAVLTGIAWDHINVFPTFENYIEQFKIFSDLIEPKGSLIYFADDGNLKNIAEQLRSDILPLPYTTPQYELRDSTTFLRTAQGELALKIFGEHNLQNLEAARLVCEQVGISAASFYSAIAGFSGALNRLQKIYETASSFAYKDFAHSPSKLKATVKAVRQQYADKKLYACMELHTFSSLTEDFLSEYADTMVDADLAFVYYNPEVVRHKSLKQFGSEQVKAAFGGENLSVFSDSKEMQKRLKALNPENSVFLFMSSGNFSGLNLQDFAKELLETK